MMKESLISGVPNIVFVILGVLLVILIIVIVVMKKKDKEPKAKDVSILDINNSGVPNSSENQEFSYGYEKEQTVVMNPVNSNENLDSIQSQPQNTSINASIPETSNNTTNQLNSVIPDNTQVNDVPVQMPTEPVNVASTEALDSQLNINESVPVSSPSESVEPNNISQPKTIVQNNEIDSLVEPKTVNVDTINSESNLLVQDDMESIPINNNLNNQ